MPEYRTKRVLNNNAVLALDEGGTEVIVTGKGVGYGVRTNGVLQNKNISRVYVPESQRFKIRFLSLLNDISYEYFDMAKGIADLAEKAIGTSLNQNLIIALADHINFAVNQYRTGNERPLLATTEMKQFYPQEYSIGEVAVEMVEKKFGVECSPEEPGAFAFHIVNSEVLGHDNDAARILQSIKEIIAIIENDMGLKLDESSLDYSRLVIHLKFFLKRVMTGDTYNEQIGHLFLNPDEGAFKGIGKSLENIAKYMSENYDYQITENERVYLLIHIARIVQSQKH